MGEREIKASCIDTHHAADANKSLVLYIKASVLFSESMHLMRAEHIMHILSWPVNKVYTQKGTLRTTWILHGVHEI